MEPLKAESLREDSFIPPPTGIPDSVRPETALVGIAKSFTSASAAGDVACILGLIGVAAVCILGRARMQLALLPGLIGVSLLYLLLPDVMGPAGYVDKRLPFVVALFGLAALDLRMRSRSLIVSTVAVLAVSIAAKQVSIATMWRSFDAQYAASKAMLSGLPAGSVILQAECSPEAVGDPRVAYRQRQPPLTHLAALASFDDARFVASNFARSGQQPIAVRERYVGFYQLQKSILHTCVSDDSAARELSRRIQMVANEARVSAPVYLLLLWQGNVEPAEAAFLAKGSNFALYRLLL
jgi:hypothetical protein